MKTVFEAAWKAEATKNGDLAQAWPENMMKNPAKYHLTLDEQSRARNHAS
ncbi:hypothetical protein [Ectopseudomonas oleovorans]|nr:hypothetical protein [Pseudomonas indoloxydans]